MTKAHVVESICGGTQYTVVQQFLCFSVKIKALRTVRSQWLQENYGRSPYWF